MIELVIVIVILGILAATALPRFVDLSGDARTAKINAALGAIKSAANIGHATALARSLAAAGSYSAEGTTVNLVNYYPAAASMTAAAGLSDPSFTAAVAAGVLTLSVTGAAATCNVTYTEAAAGAQPTYTAPGAC